MANATNEKTEVEELDFSEYLEAVASDSDYEEYTGKMLDEEARQYYANIDNVKNALVGKGWNPVLAEIRAIAMA